MKVYLLIQVVTLQINNIICFNRSIYDNGNESTPLQFTSMFSSMFSSMFWSMFTRDRGFIFFRTSIWNSKNIFGKFSSSPSLTALELKGVSLHVLQYRRVTWVTCPQRRLVKTIWVIHKYIIYVIILICISFFPLMSRTNFPEVFYTNNSYGNSRNPFRRSLSVCSRSAADTSALSV